MSIEFDRESWIQQIRRDVFELEMTIRQAGFDGELMAIGHTQDILQACEDWSDEGF